MKTNRLILATALFAGLATLSIAGPGPQYWNRPSTAAAVRKSDTVKTADVNTMACGACKTTAIKEYKSANHNGRPPLRWVQTGTKHDCTMCGGSVTVENGKTTDTMGRDCMLGAGNTACCAVTPPAPAAKS